LAARESVEITKSVAKPGVYLVHVLIWAPLARSIHVRVNHILRRHQLLSSGSASTSLKLSVKGHTIAIGASARGATPTLKVTLTYLHALAPPLAPADDGSMPTGVPGTWHLIFSDDFNGTSLNTKYWSTGWFGSGTTVDPGGDNVPECDAPGNVVEANGELDLSFTDQSSVCDGSTHPYTSGIVTTNGKFSFTDGLIEFRAWLPTTSSGQVADWPDLWLDGQSWPADGEVDVAEGLGGTLCAHYHGPSNSVGVGAGGGTGCPAGTFAGAWHTFAADWEPGIVTYYYDGQDIGCLETSGTACGNTNTTIAGAPMYIILSLGSSYANQITAPATLRIAYVRVWQH
jgi:beta-glucanase (GH16 family)